MRRGIGPLLRSLAAQQFLPMPWKLKPCIHWRSLLFTALCGLTHMGTSKILLAKRALVTVLLSVTVAYGVALSLNRDATNANVLKAYRRVVLEVHPYKGGSVADKQKLWRSALS